MKQQNEPDSIRFGFDDWAEEYEELLNSYISLSGEATDYFHVSKLTCLKRLIPGLEPATTILDFGCGIGKLASLTADLVYDLGGLLSVESQPKSMLKFLRKY